MFSLKNFVKNGFLKAIGKMADYQIILNAAGWLEKGVLDENDLMEIQAAIDAQYEVAVEEDMVDDGMMSDENIVEDATETEEPTVV